MSPQGKQACWLCHQRKIKCVEVGDSCRACNEFQIKCSARSSIKQGRPKGESKHKFRAIAAHTFVPTQSMTTPSCDESQNALRSASRRLEASTQNASQGAFAWAPPTPAWSNSSNFSPRQTFSLGSETTVQSEQNSDWTTPTVTQTNDQGGLVDIQDWSVDSVLDDHFLTQLGSTDSMNETDLDLSLYSAYIATDGALSRISSGAQIPSLADLKENGVTAQLLVQVADAIDGVQFTQHGTGRGRRRSSSSLLAMLTVKKASELAEQSMASLLAVTSGTYAARSNQDEEQIAAIMLRIDRHLGRLNAFVARFCTTSEASGLADNSPAIKVQHSLLRLHTSIRSRIETMLSTWG